MKYTLDTIKGKDIAIHCPTKEEYSKVVEMLDSIHPRKMTTLTQGWEEYGRKACINVAGYPAYADIAHYKDRSYEIITADTFIKDNQPKMEPKKVKILKGWSGTGTSKVTDTTAMEGLIGEVIQETGNILYVKFGEITKELWHPNTDKGECEWYTEEPVYTAGMWITCKEGYTNEGRPSELTHGGNGYALNKTFKIKSKDSDHKGGRGADVLWPEGGGDGIYTRAVRVATAEEITIANQAPKPVKVNIGDNNRQVTISKGSIVSHDQKTVAIEDVKAIIALFNVPTATLPWSCAFTELTIGCITGVRKEQLEEVVREYNKLNK